jgi:hypothetical protein
MRELCHTLDTPLAFEAVAGALYGHILRAMPNKSQIIAPMIPDAEVNHLQGGYRFMGSAMHRMPFGAKAGVFWTQCP